MYNRREFQHTYVTGVATTSPFSGRGILGGIDINSSAVTGLITVKDGATTIGIIGSTVIAGCYLKDYVISNGLSVTTVNTTSDVTIAWTKA